jgi:hypothetical protein
MHTSRICLFFLAMLTLVVGASAHETDQFAFPPGRNFADLGEYLNRWAYDAIERGRDAANAGIRDAFNRHEPANVIAELQSPSRLTLAVRRQWPWSVTQIEAFEGTLASPQMRRRYPGRIVAYGDRFDGVYRSAFFPLDPRGWSHLAFFSSTIKVYGVYMGTDKIGHFTDEGIHYYYTWLAARQSGASDREAIAAAVRNGTEGFMSESGMLGMTGNADYSNADLAANFAGFLFYRNLTEPLFLQGKRRNPMLVLDGAYWVISPDVGPEIPFFARFITDHLDEALNPGYFDPYLRPALGRNLARRADLLLRHYADESGNPRPREWFDHKLEQLGTFQGLDYGHLGRYDELVSIGACCFPDRPDDRAAIAASRFPSARFLSSLPPHEIPRADRERKPPTLVKRSVDAASRRDRAPNSRDAFGRTSLHDAAQRATPQEVQSLLKNGADPRTPDDYGTTPLHLACRRGSFAIALLLLDHGADPNAVNQSGTTPLHEAASAGDVDTVQLLLTRGAHPDARDARHQFPAQVAKSHGFTQLSQALTLLRPR